MKAVIFFKNDAGLYLSWDTAGVVPPPNHSPSNAAFMEQEITEHPDTLLKNGCRLVSKTDLPTQSVPGAVETVLEPPKTLPEIDNLLFCLSKLRYGTVVGQLLDEEYVVNSQHQYLSLRLAQLVQASCTLHQELSRILKLQRERSGPAVDGKK